MDMVKSQGRLRFRRNATAAYAGRAASVSHVKHQWQIFWLFLWGLSAAILTAAGFFFDSVPLALAYTPFLAALITPSRGLRAALVGGHFAIVFEIAATGLLHMGFSAWIVFPGFLLAVLTLSAGFAIFGVGLAAVILLFIPYFPGNPLLITGTLYPGFGVFGIVLLAASSMAAARWRAPWARVLAVFLTIALPSVAVHSAQNDGFLNIPLLRGWTQTASLTTRQSEGDDRARLFESVALSRSSGTDIADTNLTWHLLLALRDIPKGSLVITGENLLTAEDDIGQRILCRMARASELDLYVGVASADGPGEIWRYSGQTCPEGTRIYRAVIGIPGITGAFWPDTTDTGAPVNVPTALDRTGFLACFEAFTLHRWIAMGLRGLKTVVVVSNDHWTDPLPVALLRTKVSNQFAQLFGIEVFHAGRKQNILVLKGENPIAEENTEGG